jgi:peroxiredoxin
MTSDLPEERPQRRREYSGPGSTLGLAALIVLVVAAAIWWFEFRGSQSAGDVSTPGLGIVDLPDGLNPTGHAPAAREGRAAPNFTLAASESRNLTLADYRGRYVLLNFWASWCPPCAKEIPDIQSFYEHHANREFTVLAVNQQEQPDTVRHFLDEFGVTYPVVLDRSGEVNEAYGVGRGMPISFLVAPDGVIEKAYFGQLTEENFAEIDAKLP